MAVLALVAMLGLSACNENQAIQRAASPPFLVGQIENRTLVTEGDVNDSVRRAITSLGGARGVHVVLNVRDPRVAARAMAALRGAGVDLARVVTVADARSMMVLRVYTLAVPDCAAALRRSWFGDVSNSMTPLGQCTEARALGQEISDPGDLVSPAHLQAANGAHFGRVVELWEAGGEKQREGGGSSGGGSSGGGGGMPGAAMQKTVDSGVGTGGDASDSGSAQSGVADNPLLSGAPLSPGARSE